MEGRGKHTVRLQEREREQRTHRRVEEEKPIGGSSKDRGKKKKGIYLSFSPFSLSLSEGPLWDQVAVELNFTWLRCCPSQPLQAFLLIVLRAFSSTFGRGRSGCCGGQSSQKEGRDRICRQGFCSVVECHGRAGCLLGEAVMELGRPRAGLLGLGCGRCWRGASWCWWRDGEVWRRAPLPAAAWGTRWTATAWGSTPYPKTSPGGLRGCK